MSKYRKKNNKYAELSEPQATLDFHKLGLLRPDDVKGEIDKFLEDSKGLSKVLIITGKGLHSSGGEAKVKPLAKAYLQEHPLVRRVLESRRDRGGSGALEVDL